MTSSSQKKLARKRAGSGRTGPRAKPSAATRRKLQETAPDIVDALENRLARARDLVRALHYVGYGLSSLHDDFAPAIAGLAWALDINIDAMRTAIGLPGRRR